MVNFFLEEMSWPEVKEVLKETDLAVLPVGCTEEHGFHLPLNVDTACVNYIADKAAGQLYDKHKYRIVIAPTIPYGDTNLYEFPGTLGIRAETLVHLVSDVCRGLIAHGFRKLLILNGHFGNVAHLIAVGRKILSEFPYHYFVLVNWWSLASEVIPEIRESELGGMFHACELETSVSLVIQPDRVCMDKAVTQLLKFPLSPCFASPDMFSPQKVTFMHSRRSVGDSGVMGDPTKASREKGERILKTTVDNLVALILELKDISFEQKG